MKNGISMNNVSFGALRYGSVEPAAKKDLALLPGGMLPEVKNSMSVLTYEKDKEGHVHIKKRTPFCNDSPESLNRARSIANKFIPTDMVDAFDDMGYDIFVGATKDNVTLHVCDKYSGKFLNEYCGFDDRFGNSVTELNNDEKLGKKIMQFLNYWEKRLLP